MRTVEVFAEVVSAEQEEVYSFDAAEEVEIAAEHCSLVFAEEVGAAEGFGLVQIAFEQTGGEEDSLGVFRVREDTYPGSGLVVLVVIEMFPVNLY